MGRSVSYLSRADAIAYIDFNGMYSHDDCQDCEGTGWADWFNDYIGPSPACEECKGTGKQDAPTGPDEWDWGNFMEDLVRVLQERFPSLTECDRWDNVAHSETRIVLENEHAEIGVSEYCGLASVSMRYKFDCDWEYSPRPLAVAWTQRAKDGFMKHISKRYPEHALHKIGSFSNGEGVYRRAAS